MLGICRSFRYMKGCLSSVKGIRKGCLFCQIGNNNNNNNNNNNDNNNKRIRGWTSGWSLLYKTFLGLVVAIGTKFSVILEKQKKRNTSEGVPFFEKMPMERPISFDFQMESAPANTARYYYLIKK